MSSAVQPKPSEQQKPLKPWFDSSQLLLVDLKKKEKKRNEKKWREKKRTEENRREKKRYSYVMEIKSVLVAIGSQVQYSKQLPTTYRLE